MYKNIYHGVYIPTPNESDFKSAVEVLKKFGLESEDLHSQYLGVNLSEPLFAGRIYSFHFNMYPYGNDYSINELLTHYTPQLEIGQCYNFNGVPYVPVINDEIVSSEKGNFKVNINTELAPLIRYQIDKELGPVYMFGLKGDSDKAYIAVEFKDIHALIAAKPTKAPIFKGSFVVVTESFSVELKDSYRTLRFLVGDILMVEDIPKEGVYQMFGNFFVPEHIIRLAKVEETLSKMSSITIDHVEVQFTGSGANIFNHKFGAEGLKAIRTLLMEDVEMKIANTKITFDKYYYLHLFSGIPYNI